MKQILKHLDVAILVVIAIGCIGLSAADFFGLAPALEFPRLTLLFLGLLGCHFVVAYLHQGKQAELVATELRRLGGNVVGVEFKPLETGVELERYLATRILEAKKSVCDLSWKLEISSEFSANHRVDSHGGLERAIVSMSDRIWYREVFVFNDIRRLQKLDRRLREKKSGYSCAYYRDNDLIPRIQFVVIDEEEVVFTAVSAESPMGALRGRAPAALFKAYFERVWAGAVKLKEGPTEHKEAIDAAKKQFRDVSQAAPKSSSDRGGKLPP